MRRSTILILHDAHLADNLDHMKPMDRFIEQFRRRNLRAYFLRENRIRPRELEEWIYPSEEQVRAAEVTIGKPLPPSYQHLILNFHPGELPFDLYWVGGTGTCWVDGGEATGGRDSDDLCFCFRQPSPPATRHGFGTNPWHPNLGHPSNVCRPPSPTFQYPQCGTQTLAIRPGISLIGSMAGATGSSRTRAGCGRPRGESRTITIPRRDEARWSMMRIWARPKADHLGSSRGRVASISRGTGRTPAYQRALDNFQSSGRSTSPRRTGLRWKYSTVRHTVSDSMRFRS